MGGTADDQSAPLAKSQRGERYVRLAEINVRHEFYTASNGVCRDLVIAPTAQTAARLAMFGFITRQRADGIDLIWESRRLIDAGGMLAAVQNGFGEMPETLRANFFGTPLLFTVSLTNPEFANFTDMPTSLQIGEPPLLLSNIATSITSAVAPDLAADLSLDWNRTVVRPPEPVPPVTAWNQRVADVRAEALSPESAEPDEDAEPEAIPANLADAEWQLYVAKSTRFALLSLYLAPPSRPAARTRGWNGFPLRIAASDDPSASPFSPCSYTLRFAARRTTWRYLVAARSGALDAESLAIVGADDGSKGDFVRLDAPETLPGGQPAICFESAAPIAIRQQPAKTYKLLGYPLKGRRAQTTLVPILPIATTGRIAPATGVAAPPGQPPPPARSDIYVFI